MTEAVNMYSEGELLVQFNPKVSIGQQGKDKMVKLSAIILYCILSIHLFSASYSAHQSEALPLREAQRKEMAMAASYCRNANQINWVLKGCGCLSKYRFPRQSKPCSSPGRLRQ